MGQSGATEYVLEPKLCEKRKDKIIMIMVAEIKFYKIE
jgi:hypothetical protein